MKKLILLLAVSCLAMVKVSAQDKIPYQGNHELKFNIAYAIAGIPEIDYEYILNDNMGIGMTAGVSIEKSDKMQLRSEFIPNIRMYFGKNRASGFFIEANTGMFSISDPKDNYDSLGIYLNTEYNKSLSFGFGASVGMKLLTKSNVVGEVILGGGRLFGSSSTGGYLRLGITIGKRF